MGLSLILSVNDNVINDTTVTFNGGKNGHGFKNFTCKQTFNLEF